MSTNSSEFNGGGLENGSTTSSCYPSSTLFHSSTKQTPSLDYLQLLLKDKHQLAAFPNVFTHVDRLIDEEINRVRVAIFQCEFTKEPLQLPEPIGEMTVKQEKVFVPTKEYPDYNFVGRILGPRGMTAKQLEQETSCKIMVRGKGSMRDKKKEEQNRGKPNWEHLNDELHVLIQCEDTSNRIELKISRAIEEVKKLLVPAAEDDDELKKKQLMELALINRAYKNGDQTPNSAGGNSKNGSILQTSLLNSSLNSSIHSSPGLVGAPLIMPPTMAGRTPQHSFTHLPLATNNPMAQALAFNGAFGVNGAGALNASSTASMPTLLTASAPIQPMFSVAGAVGATAPTVIDYSQLFLNQVPQQPLDLTQIQLQQQQQQLAFMLQAQASGATTAGIFGDYGVLAGTAGGPMVHSRSIGHQVRDQSHPYATPSATASANKKDR